jgi:UDP-N-acetylmuramoyl-tripeptide--D-alanyl-D-alanine ligase
MIPLTLAEIAEAVGGTVHSADPTRIVRGPVVLDSRQVLPGSLFAAFEGANSDGHAYAAHAATAGAAATVASRPVPAPSILVPDVRSALARLAVRNLAGCSPLTIGVTGSFGKTTTKDLLAAVLEAEAPTIATVGSLNNELGLPLTALRADELTRYLVLEMGAARAGDLRYLTSIANPRIGVVLAVGNAHVATFLAETETVAAGDPLDVVAAAKAELVEALPPASAGGIAVLNADDPRVAAMAADTAADVVTFGRKAEAMIRAVDERLTQGAPTFTLVTPHGRTTVRLSLMGTHNTANALAAAATAWALGISPERIAAALSSAEPRSDSRMAVRTRLDNDVTVIDDAYNAFPESMEAALRATAALAANTSRRTIAILGEMVAQGADSAARHRMIGTLAADLGFAALIVVDGPDSTFYDGVGPAAMAAAARAAAPAMTLHRTRDRAEALERALGLIRPGDVVLVKGSHDLGLSILAEALLIDPGP